MAELKENLKYMKEIVREIYAFSYQLEDIKNMEERKKVYIERTEKELLEGIIISLIKQLKILNKAVPRLVDRINLYPKIPFSSSDTKSTQKKINEKLTKISYEPEEGKEISVVIDDNDRKIFLENLSNSRLFMQELNKKYPIEEEKIEEFTRPNFYAKLSNYFFKDISDRFIEKGYFSNLNRNLRKINSRFVIRTYVSMIFFTTLLAFFIGLFLFTFLLFYEISFSFPFISLSQEILFIEFLKLFWIIPFFPAVSLILIYIYPLTEARSFGNMIDRELPFATIHMSAIASSNIEPTNIFKIILKEGEYKYVNIEFKKLINLMNFHGQDFVSALRKVSMASPSIKLKELLNGLAITITSGGDIARYLNKKSEEMLFEYRLEIEKYNKMSETFMDIYISIAIAAPMVFLMILVIIGSTGLLKNFIGLSFGALNFLSILILTLLNIFFLAFLRLKQPPI